MHKFGTTSRLRLESCHHDLQLIFNTTIKISSVDFSIADGHRSVERQNEYFKDGKSKIDGITRKGKHNYMPSLAADFYPYVNGKANYDVEHVTYIAGMLHAVSEMLFIEGKITHKLRWGGNWDMDGVILLDQSFDDRPHVELVNA